MPRYRAEGRHTCDRGGRHQLQGKSRMRSILACLVEPGIAKLGQDPGEAESRRNRHQKGNDESLHDQAAAQRKVDAARRPRDQLVQDVESPAAPDDRGPA